VQGLGGNRWQGFRTIAGMVAVITVVLAGSTVGLIAGVAFNYSLVAALIAGPVVALAALVPLMRFQRSAWERANTTPIIADDGEESS